MKKNNKKGFTLVELVIVVAVMAILVAVAIPTVSSITNSAKTSVYNTNCRTIESMIKLEIADLSNTTNTVTSLSGTQIQKALNEAKLGIEGEETDNTQVYYYHSLTGAVDDSDDAVTAPSGITGTDKVYTITFDTTGVATVTPTD